MTTEKGIAKGTVIGFFIVAILCFIFIQPRLIVLFIPATLLLIAANFKYKWIVINKSDKTGDKSSGSN